MKIPKEQAMENMRGCRRMMDLHERASRRIRKKDLWFINPKARALIRHHVDMIRLWNKSFQFWSKRVAQL